MLYEEMKSTLVIDIVVVKKKYVVGITFGVCTEVIGRTAFMVQKWIDYWRSSGEHPK